MIQFSKFYYPVMFVVLIRGFSGAINGTSYPILHHIAVLLNGATWALLIIGYKVHRR